MRPGRPLTRWSRLLAVIALPALLFGALPSGAVAEGPDTTAEPLPTPEEHEVVQITVSDENGLAALAATGADLTERVVPTDGGIEVEAVLTPSEQDALRDAGFDIGSVVLTAAEGRALQAEHREQMAEIAAAEAIAVDEVRVQRLDWFENYRGTFVNIEAKTSAGASAETILTATLDTGPGTEIGSGPTITLSRFVDAGQYMYHRVNQGVRVDAVPDRVRITSSGGGSVEGDFEQWLGPLDSRERPRIPGRRPVVAGGYEGIATGFVDSYMDATQVYERIESLAAEFPDLAEIVELPNKTGGYRRPALGLIGGFTNTAVSFRTLAYGHEGGNDVRVAFADPGAPDSPLAVTVDGDVVTVSLGTGADGAPTSTAAQVVAALDAEAGTLLEAFTYRGNAGQGVAQTGESQLSDGLSAPDSVSHDPFTVRAIRIGAQRDGSKTGVFAYSQEHAREWVTPLVAVESAERLLRNYETDPLVRSLVDDLDIFIVPSINPDGTHYSMYDFNFQRRNLTNYCPTIVDPLAQDAWGVDLNRNFRVGSRTDGYAGASGSCTSDVYSGPQELSEPEAKNEVWLTDTYDNIRFSMNIHSFGGYFMWSPGAYRQEGRQTLPRPPYGVEQYFLESSERILARIEEHRDTVIVPGRTGPTSDVLYSAAGNSADHHWYERGIIAWNFEVGADIYNTETDRWQGVGFQPPFAEGYEESQEFSNGLMGMLEVAQTYADDRRAPLSRPEQRPGSYEDQVGVTFELSEPATIHYTTDGSRPTLSSPTVEARGIREEAAPIVIDETTTLHWFSIDIAGNVERGYDPDGRGRNYMKARYTIR